MIKLLLSAAIWGLMACGSYFSIRATIGIKRVHKLLPDKIVPAFLELYSTNQKNSTAAFLYVLALFLEIVYVCVGG